MLYERLYETDGTTVTPMCQGAMLDKKGEATIGQPLLLYIKDTNPSGYLEIQNYTGTPTNYKRPSQIFENASNRTSLNFGLENDEFFQTPVGRNLFETFYQDYIVSKSSVSKLLQFKNILLKYKSKKSQLVQFSDEIQALPFSEESYGNDAWDRDWETLLLLTM